MLILHATADIIRVVTGSAADVEPAISVMETDNSAPPVVQDIPNIGPIASITTATTTTVLDCTTANRRRNVKHMQFYNNHASQATTLRVEFFDGSISAVLANVTLLAGEMLVFNQSGIWLHYDVNGGTYPQVGAIATQAEMEAGTSLVTTVSPGRQHFHPSASKFWVAAGVTGNDLGSYNVTSLTDTAGGVLGVTIAVDFSGANWVCLVSVQRVNTTAAESNGKNATIRSTARAAGTVEVDCWDDTVTTQVNEDPTQWYVVGYGDQA
jgi:hypothetical protein